MRICARDHGRPGRSVTAGLAGRLADLVGAANVIEGAVERAYYAHDIAGPAAHEARLVVRPSSVEEAAACIAALTGAGCALTVRGGGHSYTGGYGPARAGAAILDLSGLDRIVAANETDGWITVEAGCTWSTLYDALAASRRRTPFFGPLSGIVSTVGGAASQNAAFFGTARHGPMSANVLGLDVATADGTIMRLGTVDGRDFARDFGPDAVGLFLGDGGALGVKLRVTMRSIPALAALRFASFAFESFRSVIDTQIALAGLDDIADSYGFDSGAHENMRRAGFTIGEQAAAMGDVARAGGGLVRGLTTAFKTAAGGRRALTDIHNSLHLVIESTSEAAAETACAAVAACAEDRGGAAIPDTIPRFTRAKPFRPLKSLLGPDGERWLPLHGLLPPSRAKAAADAARRRLSESESEMARHGVRVTWLTTQVADRLLLEPQFFWPDALTPFHLRAVTPAQKERFANRVPNERGRALVHELRAALACVLAEHGAIHYQIGTYYPYLRRIDPGQRAILEAAKQALDPERLINPGVLGL